MKTPITSTVIFLVCFSPAGLLANTDVEEKVKLEFVDIRIEPVREGRNVVEIQVRNTSAHDQVLGMWIQTNSRWDFLYRPGWGSSNFIDVIPASKTIWIRHCYKVCRPLADNTRFRFHLHARGPASKSANGKPLSKANSGSGICIKELEYYGRDLERQDLHRISDTKLRPTSERHSRTIIKIFRQFQNGVKNSDYEAVWQLFTNDFRDAECHGSIKCFLGSMKSPYTFFLLSRSDLLALEPTSVCRHNGVHVLTATIEDEPWRVSFIEVEGKWKIDSFERVDSAPRMTLPSSKAQEKAVIDAFKKWQTSVQEGKLETSWRLLANGHRRSRALQNDFETYKKELCSGTYREILLNLQPESVKVVRMNELSILNTTLGQQPWIVLFVAEDGRWKFYKLKRGKGHDGNWKDRLMATLQKRSTEHFDIYYYKGSTAEREIEQIVSQREKGVREICEFLGRAPNLRICMILFENGGTKYSETGHQGAGWAIGNTVVEVYNDKEKLDPYHEAVHILSRRYGSPPALFNEGLAVYLSERLGAHALASLKGGQSTILERVRELAQNKELIPLEELLTYTEIGSRKTNPSVAYPESASFVKFLVETYGKARFLSVYRALRNTDSKAMQEDNVKLLERIYSKPMAELKADWERSFCGPK